jgi:hypothetical protein
VGGDATQTVLLKKQIDTTLKLFGSRTSGEGSISMDLQELYKKCIAVGRSIDDLPGLFWKVYSKCEEEAILVATIDVDPSGFGSLMLELERYHELTVSLGWVNEPEKVVQRMEGLINRVLTLLLEKERNWTFDTFFTATGVNQAKFCGGVNNEICHAYYDDSIYNTITREHGSRRCLGHFKINGVKHKGGAHQKRFVRKNSKKLQWETLSPNDWMTIIYSVLLPSNEIEFYEHFGAAKMELDEALRYLRMRYDPKNVDWLIEKQNFPNERAYLAAFIDKSTDEGIQALKEWSTQVVMPKKLSDGSHWGHVGWKYVTFCRSLTK